jgi:predicted small lipoprotein YifL
MKAGNIQWGLVALSFLAGCASQGPVTQEPPAVSAAPAAASAKPAENLREEGAFKRVVRNGKTLYCDNSPSLGTRMSKPRCLNEADYERWRVTNRAIIDEMERAPRGPLVEKGELPPR